MRITTAILGLFAATTFAHPAHADNHAPVVLDEISKFDCVKDCWRAHSDIEDYNRRQFCHSHAYDMTMKLSRKVLPCIKESCDHHDKDAIVLESRVWFCDFCGYLPDDAEISC
ncbi:uncharacterized protein N0V89_003312 [Didymosphaeria variabile]|uniref:Uncharacterized protein n=1 Tax=Didymosphaeria variabile TaxID=1932322 RepID=A0A9W8XVV3_9PLEO|nr:uncharacterized protein N0V89_003312 [Didymosphaeria variabile]KAJ4358728.1 hypothetical protein N0V89_003312 [Didymosphaeria variabile]